MHYIPARFKRSQRAHQSKTTLRAHHTSELARSPEACRKLSELLDLPEDVELLADEAGQALR